jgi:hypothetical protein
MGAPVNDAGDEPGEARQIVRLVRAAGTERHADRHGGENAVSCTMTTTPFAST